MRSYENSAKGRNMGKVHAYLIYEQTLLKKLPGELIGKQLDWVWMGTRGSVSLSEYWHTGSKITQEKNQHNYHHEFNLVVLN